MFVSYTSERKFSRTCSRTAFAKNICPLIFERNVTAIESTYLVFQERRADKVISGILGKLLDIFVLDLCIKLFDREGTTNNAINFCTIAVSCSLV